MTYISRKLFGLDYFLIVVTYSKSIIILSIIKNNSKKYYILNIKLIFL